MPHKEEPFAHYALGTQIIILCTFVLTLLLFVWLIIIPRIGPLRSLAQRVVPSVSSPSAVKATLHADLTSGVVALDQVVPVTLKLSLAKKSPVGGFSLRLIMPKGSGLTVADADLSNQGAQAKVNSELVEAGWIFPVNKIVSSADGQELWVELNGAWVGTGEPKLVNELTLATFDLRAKTAGNYQLTFDKSASVSAVYLSTPPQPELTLSSAKVSFK